MVVEPHHRGRRVGVMLLEAIVSDLYLVGIRLAIDARGVHLDDHIFT
jgi:GNAT superfamily N-acetyltransferase